MLAVLGSYDLEHCKRPECLTRLGEETAIAPSGSSVY